VCCCLRASQSISMISDLTLEQSELTSCLPCEKNDHSPLSHSSINLPVSNSQFKNNLLPNATLTIL
jgi:hypothetical protein